LNGPAVGSTVTTSTELLRSCREEGKLEEKMQCLTEVGSRMDPAEERRVVPRSGWLAGPAEGLNPEGS